MRSFLVKLVSPSANLPACMPQVSKPLSVQAFVSEPAVKAFDVGVLNWFAGLDMNQLNTLVDAPGQEVSRGQFAAVVHPDPFRLAALGNHAVERSRDASTRQTGIYFQR